MDKRTIFRVLDVILRMMNLVAFVSVMSESSSSSFYECQSIILFILWLSKIAMSVCRVAHREIESNRGFLRIVKVGFILSLHADCLCAVLYFWNTSVYTNNHSGCDVVGLTPFAASLFFLLCYLMFPVCVCMIL